MDSRSLPPALHFHGHFLLHHPPHAAWDSQAFRPRFLSLLTQLFLSSLSSMPWLPPTYLRQSPFPPAPFLSAVSAANLYLEIHKHLTDDCLPPYPISSTIYLSSLQFWCRVPRQPSMSLRWTTTDNSSLAQSQFYLLTLTASFHVSCSAFLSSGCHPTEHGPQSVRAQPPLLFSLHSANREVSLNSKPSSWSFIWNILHWADMAPKNLARAKPHFTAGERAHTCVCSLTDTQYFRHLVICRNKRTQDLSGLQQPSAISSS